MLLIFFKYVHFLKVKKILHNEFLEIKRMMECEENNEFLLVYNLNSSEISIFYLKGNEEAAINFKIKIEGIRENENKNKEKNNQNLYTFKILLKLIKMREIEDMINEINMDSQSLYGFSVDIIKENNSNTSSLNNDKEKTVGLNFRGKGEKLYDFFKKQEKNINYFLGQENDPFYLSCEKKELHEKMLFKLNEKNLIQSIEENSNCSFILNLSNKNLKDRYNTIRTILKFAINGTNPSVIKEKTEEFKNSEGSKEKENKKENEDDNFKCKKNPYNLHILKDFK